ncbi:MAG: NAD(P)H-dependent oxidoreductase subunit E [Syntrophales bacterium]|jgi:NADH:ubiquinone oxidoreductase subunit E|nr:NAD(P)H-dependent oxidoreductase subunit E [Syntrophales bacterium]MCK9527229.1 NAD(P)H-dependent oxidoreductase subunit E [Syntrophales bacterium]MDX9921301.1 NAD(P)H-dependent oxidoreductase subunit E [Syntrophales bacterium]
MKRELLKEFTADQLERVDDIIDTHRTQPGSLLLVLEKVQEVSLFLPLELQRYIARRMGVSASEVHGVVSFYSYFRMAPKGRKAIKVCTGTACYVKRAEDIIERLSDHLGIKLGEVTPDGEYSIEEARCLGACGLAPVLVIGDRTSGLVNPEKAEEVLEKP